MNLLAISDLHLNPFSPDRNQIFLNFLDLASENRSEVLIIGDLFDLWFGQEDLTFDYQRPILSKMSSLAAAGLVMIYVEGNRDFGISAYQGEIFRGVYPVSVSLNWGERKVYAEHGDLINLDDWQYRFWRRISKNQVSLFLLKHLPSSFLLRLATSLEKKMKNTNLRYKRYYPEDHCRKFYENQFKHGSEIVIVGHFHEEREVGLNWNKKTMLFYSLPGWESGFRYLVIPPNDEKPYFKGLM
jgi:UDP-2,3-diacylglucosamine hydrolase